MNYLLRQGILFQKCEPSFIRTIFKESTKNDESHRNMGGKAVDGRRISAEEYDTLSKKITHILQEVYDKVYIPMSLKSKQYHGDIDFVVSEILSKEGDNTVPGQNENHITDASELLKAETVRRNGPTTSYKHDGVQIDVHLCPQNEFDMCCRYKDNGDVSNLIGMMCHRIGCIYGMDGLRMFYFFQKGTFSYSPTPERYELKLSESPQKIMKFLGLSYNTFMDGFNDPESVVDFLVTSPYFSVDVFMLNAKSKASHRDRLKTRPQHVLIRQCMERRSDLPNRKFDLSQTHQEMLDFFDMHEQYQRDRECILRRYLYKQRINGRVVNSLTGLEGPTLGGVISRIKQTISFETLQLMDDEALYAQIVSLASGDRYYNE